MIQLFENSLKILQWRYLCKDANDTVIEMPDELFRRGAKVVSAAELFLGSKIDAPVWKEKYYKLIVNYYSCLILQPR
jgi:ribonucleotide reductase alpha subunit